MIHPIVQAVFMIPIHPDIIMAITIIPIIIRKDITNLAPISLINLSEFLFIYFQNLNSTSRLIKFK